MQNLPIDCVKKLVKTSIVKWDCCRFADYGLKFDAYARFNSVKFKRAYGFVNLRAATATCASSSRNSGSIAVEHHPKWGQKEKLVWIWTENKEVMTTTVERGWNTFVFPSNRRDLADEWSSIALLCSFFVESEEVLDSKDNRIAKWYDIASPEQLEKLQQVDDLAENVVVNLLDWQMIPAENIIAAFQGSQSTVLVISKTPSEACMFLEALELGLGGVILKVEDPKAVLDLKDYFDRRTEAANQLNLSKATVTKVQMRNG